MLSRFLGIFSCLLCPLALAHDTFLLPVQNTVSVSQPVEVRMTSALSFPDLTWGVAQERIALASVQLNGETITPLSYSEGEAFLSIGFTPQNAGVSTVAMSSKLRSGDIGHENVDGYLDEIGASSDIKDAFKALPGNPSLHRSYVKHTKTFICVEPCDDKSTFMSEPVGQTLEFVKASGSADVFQLLFEGQPLTNHDVKVKNTSKETFMLKTDESGRLELNEQISGTFMLAAVALTLPDRTDGTYHSDQATLVFSR
ncbi:DUF4198 domain-containing protein [Lacimicrobium sp. SS2-24]|uniref:DUF4198 domain-containing protein n=1 Tax=Lacimicrobium sp. SS2-24 TaxID=2005569 RepID=UPI00143CAEF8|nr:DUF4198 domain-containing protein [Lacimicrobium sp. SS2-24]